MSPSNQTAPRQQREGLPAAIVFDAYGTLYDVHSITAACDQLWPGEGARVSQHWRAKQLEYTWLRTLMGHYADFEVVTRAALRHATDSLKLRLDEAGEATLLANYRALSPFPEIRDTLDRLRRVPMAILSNGCPSMLEPLVEASGLQRWITDVISVDALRLYKPTPRVYQLAVDRLNASAESIVFVSSNCWDAIGAQSFGFEAVWVNRNGAALDGLGIRPTHVIKTLDALPALVG